MHPLPILLALALPLFAAADDELWHDNKLTTAQPFPGKVLAVNVTWVGCNLLIESMGDGEKKHCIAQVQLNGPLGYREVAQADLPKPGVGWQFLNPPVEVERFSWSMGPWKIGRIFGEEDCLKKAVAFSKPKPPAVDTKKHSDFVPPISYRTIRFAEHGGGPIVESTASGFDRVTTAIATPEQQLVFSVASPPTTATKTKVAGVFLLTRQGDEWRVVDELRFEASGKESDASLAVTSMGNGDPYFTITLNQGGRGHSFAQCASYKIQQGKLVVDLPTSKVSE